MVGVAVSVWGDELNPLTATFGQWEKGDATTPSHWRMKESKEGDDGESSTATPSPDVEIISFTEN